MWSWAYALSPETWVYFPTPGSYTEPWLILEPSRKILVLPDEDVSPSIFCTLQNTWITGNQGYKLIPHTKFQSILVISVMKENLITGQQQWLHQGVQGRPSWTRDDGCGIWKVSAHEQGHGGQKGQSCQASGAEASIRHLMRQKTNAMEQKEPGGVWCEVRPEKEVVARKYRALKGV